MLAYISDTGIERNRIVVLCTLDEYASILSGKNIFNSLIESSHKARIIERTFSS